MRMVGAALGFLLGAAVAAQRSAAEPEFEETRIPHRDGSGRATIVEIHPAVPGAREFVRGEERPPPMRGELSLPSPTAAPRSSSGGRAAGQR